MLPSSTGLQSTPSPTHRRDPTRATRKGKKASSHRRYIDTAFETRAAPRAATATASLRSTSGESSSSKNHSCEAGESPKTPARTDTKRSGDGSRKRAALPDPVRARADVADERMLVRERHAPAMADAAESAVERQPPRVSGRGRPVSGELPPSRCGGALGRVSESVSSDVGTSCSHHLHSRLAPASLHRVALEASASIADAHLRHAPVSSPRPERPAARARLNPMFRTESPKTEVQTAIAMLQAAEEEKERARRRRRDERAAAKEAKRLAGTSWGGARGAAERAARSRAEILAQHRPARTDSLDSLDALDERTSHSSQSGSDASSSDDDDDGDDGSGDSGTSSISEPTETKSGARRAGRHRHHRRHHRHHHDTRHAAAKRRKTEEESKKRRRSTDDTDASEKHHKSKHHKSKHHKSKHHKSKHHKSKHHESKRRHRKTGHRRKSSREPERAHRDGDVAADASRALAIAST